MVDRDSGHGRPNVDPVGPPSSGSVTPCGSGCSLTSYPGPIALAPYVTRALVSWTPISERLLKARFQHQRGHLTILVIYAPTDQTDRAIKEDFYALLDDTVQSVPPGDLLVCLGDFNAVSGTDRLPSDQVLGPFGSGNPNENSDLFLAFARNHRLRIGGSWYRRCCWYC